VYGSALADMQQLSKSFVVDFSSVSTFEALHWLDMLFDHELVFVGTFLSFIVRVLLIF